MCKRSPAAKARSPPRQRTVTAAARFEVHLDARMRSCRSSATWRQSRTREVGTEQPVQVLQQVQVEGRGDAQCVVVGGFEHGVGLTRSTPISKRAAGGQLARLPQQAQRLVGGEVADAGAGVEHQRRAVAQARGQLQTVGKVQAHAEQVQRRVFALQRCKASRRKSTEMSIAT